MSDITLISSVQESDPGACTRAGADRAAVGGQPADPGFAVQRDQIGDQQCTVKLLRAGFQAFGINDDRQ